MNKIIRYLLFSVFLLVFALPAQSQDSGILSGLEDIYWYNGGRNWPEPPPATIPDKPRPMIAIVIDDAGVDQKRTARAVRNLKAPVTISYLAYAQHVQKQVQSAQAKGHEIILHLPWEPDSKKADAGPHHLSVSMTKEAAQENLLENLNAFEGYVGVNNHMGSKFSRHRPGLEVVMAVLKERGVFYLDSKTTPDSIAEKVAREFGVLATHRDVFLDHDEDSETVGTSLEEVESIARHRGSVIAIGHPKDVTLDALETWLPTLEEKGLQLVPLSVVVEYRQKQLEARMAAKAESKAAQ